MKTVKHSKLAILKSEYFDSYKNQIEMDMKNTYKVFSDEITQKNYFERWLDFYISGSAVYSSNIEGNNVDFDTYWKYKTHNIKNDSKNIKEIIDLAAAHYFAMDNKLDCECFLESHKILTKSFLTLKHRGKLRKKPVGVYSGDSLIYLAVEPESVESEMQKLFADIKTLLNKRMTTDEIFYFASMIHLVFVKIHPFTDGNGRAARLLEKWFIASRTGKTAWFLETEKFYWYHRIAYYRSIHLGKNYHECNYDRCVPFLLMSPDCLNEMVNYINPPFPLKKKKKLREGWEEAAKECHARGDDDLDEIWEWK